MNLKDAYLNWRAEVNLYRRIEALEKQSPPDIYQIVIVEDGESIEDAANRFCCEYDFSIEQLKNAIYLRPEDAATL